MGQFYVAHAMRHSASNRLFRLCQQRGTIGPEMGMKPAAKNFRLQDAFLHRGDGDRPAAVVAGIAHPAQSIQYDPCVLVHAQSERQ